MLKIWGRKNSINVMKVLWACDEIGLAYDRVDLGGAFGGNKEPAYLALNPNARVPTIEENGLVLWESNAIVRYLAVTHGAPGLLPADNHARWVAEQWMDWQQTTLHPPATKLFWELIRTAPEDRDAEGIEAARISCGEAWTLLDKTLGKSDFLAGAEFSMADIPLGAAAFRWYAFDIERPATPNVRAWYERLCQRPPYKFHIMNPMT